MRALGLDVGEARIGLAFGDTDVRIALPAGVIERTATEADVEAVLRQARSRDAGVLVVGMPYTLRARAGRRLSRLRHSSPLCARPRISTS